MFAFQEQATSYFQFWTFIILMRKKESRRLTVMSTNQIKLVCEGVICLRHKDDLLLGVLVGQADERLVGSHELTACLVLQLELHDNLLVVVGLQDTGSLVGVDQPAHKRYSLIQSDAFWFNTLFDDY